MLYESPHVRVEAADGVATLWLEFPGRPVNALTPARLAEFDRGLSAVSANSHLKVLVIRSGRPAGFCGGLDPEALAGLTTDEARAAFAVAGQRVLNRLAAAEKVTLAFVEGPCLGPGLELALACDYRLAVAGPDSRLGFPDAAWGLPPCWGGATRLGRRAAGLLAGEVLTAREAQRAGLVDDAFCARRAKIELRTYLDRLQIRPRKALPGWPRWGKSVTESLAAERAAFRAALRSPAVGEALTGGRLELDETANPVPPFPELVGLIGTDDRAAALVVEVALRGTAAVVATGGDNGSSLMSNALSRALAEAVGRGRATPLEAEQARGRIRVQAGAECAAAAGWAVAVDPAGPPLAFVEHRLRPRAVFAVPIGQLDDLARHAARPGRVVGLDFPGGDRAELTGHPGTTPDALAAVAAWVERLGFAPVVASNARPDAVRRAA
jgi:enoyl-CoA hydratase/carnithine racemase